MPCARRLLPLAVIALVFVVGCQSSGVAARTGPTAHFQQDRDSLNIELAATTRELDATRIELTGAITDIVTMRNAMDDYMHRLLDNETQQQEQARRMAQVREEHERGARTDDEMTRALREYIECLVQTGIEERTANEVMEKTHTRVNERVAGQNKRLEQIVQRVAQLQAKVESLQQRLAAAN